MHRGTLGLVTRLIRGSARYQVVRKYSNPCRLLSASYAGTYNVSSVGFVRLFHSTGSLNDIVRSPYPDIKEFPEINASDHVLNECAKFGDSPAFIDAKTGFTLTFAGFREQVRKVASGLHRAGLRKGDVLMIVSPNSMEYAVMFHAVISIGGTVTLTNPIYPKDDIQLQAVDSKAKFIFCSTDQKDKVDRVARDLPDIQKIWVVGDNFGDHASFSSLVNDDGSAHPGKVEVDARRDIAVLPYSSGTTGLPKGVMLSHYNLVSNLLQGRISDFWVKTEGAIISGVLPFYHIFAVSANLMSGIAWGRTTVVLPAFEPASFLEALQKYKVSLLYAVPPIILFMANHPVVAKFDLSSINRVISAAAPLGRDIEEAFLKKFPNCTIGQGYGMTETSPVVTLAPIAHSGKYFGTIGVLFPNTEAKFIDTETGKECSEKEIGELWLKGPQNMVGYLNKEKATAETIDADGWLHTGDIGHSEGDRLYLVDRMKELIKYKGLQVPPAELEALLCTHPAVADAGVVGVPDDEAGELPKAFVSLRPGGEATEEELKQFVDEKVVGYKKLRGGLVILEQIPRSAAGKILRRELKNL